MDENLETKRTLTIASSAVFEIEAASEGFSSLYEEIAKNLGRYSISSSEIIQAQEEVLAGKANLKLLNDFVGILPNANGQIFALEGEDSQYTARQIQTNTLWFSLHRGSFGIITVPDEYFFQIDESPYYILGRAIDTDDPNAERLLLMPAKKINSKENSTPYIATVLKKDMDVRDGLVSGIVESEFSTDDIERMISPTTGRFIIGADTDGSIRLTYRKRRDDSPCGVSKKGVRLSHRTTKKTLEPICNGVTAELLEEFGTAKYIAVLAHAFNIEEQVRDLFDSDNNTAEKYDEESTDNDTVTERLVDQNRELRKALLNMIISSGIADEDQAQKLVDARFPHI